MIVKRNGGEDRSKKKKKKRRRHGEMLDFDYTKIDFYPDQNANLYTVSIINNIQAPSRGGGDK